MGDLSFLHFNLYNSNLNGNEYLLTHRENKICENRVQALTCTNVMLSLDILILFSLQIIASNNILWFGANPVYDCNCINILPEFQNILLNSVKDGICEQ